MCTDILLYIRFNIYDKMDFNPLRKVSVPSGIFIVVVNCLAQVPLNSHN